MYRYAGDSLVSTAFGFDQENAGKVHRVFSELAASIYLNFWGRILIFVSFQFPKLSEVIRVCFFYYFIAFINILAVLFISVVLSYNKNMLSLSVTIIIQCKYAITHCYNCRTV